MGGKGSGRLNQTDTILKALKTNPIATEGTGQYHLPNHSGDLSAGKVLSTPVNPQDIVNKKYLTDNYATIADDVWLKNTGDTGTGDYTFDGAVVINESGADKDFRIESTTETDLFYIDASTSRIGIGTSTPATKLELRGSVTETKITFYNESDDVGFLVGSGGTWAGFGSTTNVGVRLYVDGVISRGIYIQTGTGNVGIGNTSPNSKLEVTGSTSLNGAVVVNDTGADVDFRIESDTRTHAFFLDGTNGRIGIGTSTPDVLLDIEGTVTEAKINFNNTSDGVTFTIGSAGTWAGFGATSTSTDLRLYNLANSNGIIIKHTTYNVGINTTTPDERFSVSDKFLVTTAGLNYWKDDASGLPYGHMYTNTTISVTISASNTPTEIGDTWTSGEMNNASFGASHYITIGKAGRYLINWSLSIAQNSPSAAIQCEQGVMVNGTKVNGGVSHRTISSTTDVGASAGTTICDCATNDQISLYVENQTNTTNIDVQHGNLTITHIGGT